MLGVPVLFTAFKTVVLSGSSPNFYWDFDSGIHSGKAQKEERACIKKEKCFSCLWSYPCCFAAVATMNWRTAVFR